MLTQHDLQQLDESFRDRLVLTVYLHPSVDDPAERFRWEAEFEQAVRVLDADAAPRSHAERAALDAAIAHVRARVAQPGPHLGAKGLVVIADARGISRFLPLDTPTPTLAAWQRGAVLAPLLADARPTPATAVLLVDDHGGRLFRFTPPHELTRVESRAVTLDPDVERTLGGPTGRFHAGTRGGTTADRLDRRQRGARDRLFGAMIPGALALAGPDGLLALGGTPAAVAAARARVPETARHRILPLDGIAHHATDVEIAAVVGAALAARVAVGDVEFVRTVMETAGNRGRAVAGVVATRTRLARDEVADLLLSARFVAEHPQEADELLRQAFRQGARVLEVTGTAAAEIDADAEGVAARLRFVTGADGRR